MAGALARNDCSALRLAMMASKRNQPIRAVGIKVLVTLSPSRSRYGAGAQSCELSRNGSNDREGRGAAQQR